MGCYQTPARICELRRQGHNIHTALIKLWDDQGYEHHNVALYTLIEG